MHLSRFALGNILQNAERNSCNRIESHVYSRSVCVVALLCFDACGVFGVRVESRRVACGGGGG